MFSSFSILIISFCFLPHILSSYIVNTQKNEKILVKTSGTSEELDILDDLSELIDDARATNDKEERSELYMEAMEQILDLAIELPVYQRSVLYAYNSKVIKSESISGEINPYSSPLDRIWEIEFAA